MADEQHALPVSPPIFIPAAVTSQRAERAPWVGVAAGLGFAALPTTVSLWFGTQGGDFQPWTWQPFVPAAAWAALVFALAAVALAIPRGNSRVKAAILGSALLLVAGLLTAANVEHHTRSHILPRLLSYGRELPAPTGFEVAGAPTRIAVDDRDGKRSFADPTLAVTWQTTPATEACPLLERQLTGGPGWQGGASLGGGCRFIKLSGRIRVDVSSGAGTPKTLSSALVTISPNDGG